MDSSEREYNYYTGYNKPQKTDNTKDENAQNDKEMDVLKMQHVYKTI